MSKKKMSLGKRILLAVAAVLVAIVAAFLVYTSDYYHADARAWAAMESDGPSEVDVRSLDGGYIAFVPQDPVAGLVFYPGGKVEPESYAPQLKECAEHGVLCVLVKPPFNLAILDSNAADGALAQFPEVDSWYLAGHSLGGVVASSYVDGHAQDVDGLLLLAAYSSADISDFSGPVISLVGSNDQVLNREKYEEAQDMLPPSAEERVIEGGNHAGYGDYGAQQGDGTASITPQEQQEAVVDAVDDLLRLAA